MPHINIEIKAKCAQPEIMRDILKSLEAIFVGIDHQIDTYFNVKAGRLKLREGNIENSLIYYRREDNPKPKRSDVTLFKTEPNSALKKILTSSLGTKAVVDKRREIYFIDNVKFHIDSVVGLGSFVEIEAIDESGTIGHDKLQRQCRHYMDVLKIKQDDLITNSYSDMV